MYYSYFGLKEAPFSIAVNPRYLYMSPSHRDALAHLLYGVGAGGGFIVLTGEVGTGKTTINRCLIEQLPDKADLAIILNPALDARDLLATVCDELEIEIEGSERGLKALTDALHDFLLENHARGRKTVLMIDEAQHLDFDVLEQIRLLTNLETDEEKLLHIILIGQPELAQRLARPELRQLNQRVTARFDLSPLTRDETAAYIRHRLHVAGMPAGQQLFDRRLVRAIHRESQGVPRLINLLCDRLLLGAYGRNRERPDRALLKRAVREVLGETGDASRGPRGLPAWQLPAVATAAIVIVALGFWLWLSADDRGSPSGQTPREAAVARGPEAGVGAEVESGVGLTAPIPAGVDATNADAGAAGTAAGTSENGRGEVEPPATTATATVAGVDGRERAWFLSPRKGTRFLASLYGIDDASATDPCDLSRSPSLACVRESGESWTGLLRDPRPALLALLDSRRFEGRALLLGVSGDQAQLATASGIVTLPLTVLGELWTGQAWRLWQRPTAIGRTLGRGDAGADVTVAAELFARLDGQASPLTVETFNASLEERVRLFQREQGLVADGVLGEQTLRALVLAAGDDLDFTAARSRFSEQVAAGEGR